MFAVIPAPTKPVGGHSLVPRGEGQLPAVSRSLSKHILAHSLPKSNRLVNTGGLNSARSKNSEGSVQLRGWFGCF
jgi:hypothetical protein